MHSRPNRFPRWIFAIAAIEGFITLLPIGFMEDIIGRQTPPPITHPEYFYGFIGVALMWQVLFVMIARDPRRYRSVMLVAVLEKLAFALPAIVLYSSGRLAQNTMLFGLIDLVFAILFIASYRSVGRRQDFF
ncbi:MAG: hypothetical protein ACRYG5_09480 [Janthinobacterium lividum]